MTDRGRPSEQRPLDVPLPLAGLLVADFSAFLAGPWCTQTLADFGAQVIKVEKPGGGDGTRVFTPPSVAGESPYYLGLNRNKKSLLLDLKSQTGQHIALDLAARADIVIENFSPGVMTRLGLGYDAVAQRNPRTIYCSVSGYGTGGPFSDLPGFDAVFQAESGLMSITGERDGPPMRTAVPIIDITSMNATIAILAALAARDRHGIGQYVEVALFDTALTLLSYYGSNCLVSGIDPRRNGNSTPVSTPTGMFATSDGGAIYISCSTQRMWERLVTGVLGSPPSLCLPEYATNRDRTRHQDEIVAKIAAEFAKDTRDNWMAKLREAQVAAGAVRTVKEALHSPAAQARGIVTTIRHSSGEDIPNVAPPFRLAKTPVAEPRAAPTLGQHNDEVLADVLGYSADQVRAFEDAGAFGTGRQAVLP